jgi:hypothetical protein
MKSKIIALSFFVLVLSAVSVYSQTEIRVDPPTQSKKPGETATVIINISNAADLYGFQFSVGYDSAYLTDNSPPPVLTYGNFLSGVLGTDYYCIDPVNESGRLNNYACSKLRPGPGDSGEGDLLTIDFVAYGIGISPIRILNTKLSDNMSQNLSFVAFDGEVVVYMCQEGEQRWNCYNNTGACRYGNETCSGGTWDNACVGGTDASPEVCNILAGDDDDDDCNGVVNDVGGFDNVIDTQCQCYDDDAPLGSESCNDIDDDCNQLIDDNIANVSCAGLGWFGICADEEQSCQGGQMAGCDVAVPDETIEPYCNNSVSDDCMDDWDNACGGDITRNGCVGLGDLVLIGANFGLTSGFNPETDVKRDSEIDIFDLVIVGSDFGQKYYGYSLPCP